MPHHNFGAQLKVFVFHYGGWPLRNGGWAGAAKTPHVFFLNTLFSLTANGVFAVYGRFKVHANYFPFHVSHRSHRVQILGFCHNFEGGPHRYSGPTPSSAQRPPKAAGHQPVQNSLRRGTRGRAQTPTGWTLPPVAEAHLGGGRGVCNAPAF